VLQVREKTPEIDVRRSFTVGSFPASGDWRSVLAIVKPETIVAWHRAGFGLFWTWKVWRGQRADRSFREFWDLIRKMCQENPRWGAPRIHGMVLKLGIDISESSVSKYMLALPQAAVPDLAHFPGESSRAASLHRLKCGPRRTPSRA
jgi:hypothetical protein